MEVCVPAVLFSLPRLFVAASAGVLCTQLGRTRHPNPRTVFEVVRAARGGDDAGEGGMSGVCDCLFLPILFVAAFAGRRHEPRASPGIVSFKGRLRRTRNPRAARGGRWEGGRESRGVRGGHRESGVRRARV
jgi:hypothetical protein